MIISASRRTDIPVFCSRWFYQRLEEGFVAVRNPFNANQLTKIRLDADMADAIVLWTKNPAPMLDRLDELDARGGGRKACGGRRTLFSAGWTGFALVGWVSCACRSNSPYAYLACEATNPLD